MDEKETISLRNMLTAKKRRWWIVRFLPAAVGLILLISGVLKAIDMDLFVRQVRDYGIISNHFLLILSAWGVILAEFTLGTALIVSYRPKLTIPLTVLLLLIFLGVTAWAWFTGVTEDCGCFGSWMQRTPGEALIEDLVFLVALIPACFVQEHSVKPVDHIKVWAVIVACVTGLTLPFLSGYPISRISRSIPESIDIQQSFLEIRDIVQMDLEHGAYLFVLMSTDCLHCREAFEYFKTWAKEPDIPDVIALSANDKEQIQSFTEEIWPDFPVLQISEEGFWRLLGDGDIPRLLLLRDQRILKVWDEDIPDINSIREILRE
ncbi:hypothetical protein OAC89_01860 [Deltaproteobacteria bacterium]|nr:hypothetical protein [Deltaproteobacteria bacterium]